MHLPEAAGVPQLVAEVAAKLDVFFVEQHVEAKRRAAHRAKAQGIRAILGNQLQRVGRVAQALRHLAPLFVANDAGEIDVAERQIALVLVAGHDHASDPEKDDVRPGDEIGGGIKFVERLGLLRPAHRGKRPKPRTAPRVEHVGVLLPTLTLGRIEVAVDFLAAIPHRNAVPPPKLATDAPILQAAHPVVVSLRPALRIKLHRSVGDAGPSGILAGIFQKPLLGKTRLDRHIGALAEADFVFVILRLGKRPHFLELGRSGFAGFKTIHAGQLDTGQAIHFAVRFEDVDDFQSVPLANIKVGLVVCWRDLQHACAKLDVDMLVGNDRQMRLVFHRQRPHRMFANQVSVARIVRVHRKPTVAGDGLRPRGRNLQPSARLLDDLHLEIIELAVLLLHDDLLVRKGSQRFWTPVHHPLAAINQPFFIKIHEHALHAFRVALVHRETQPRPVARRTEFL